MSCLYYRHEGHVKNDYLVWKKVIKEEKNSKPKIGVNVAMVKWDQLVMDVCVTTKGQGARMPKANMRAKELLEKEVYLTKGRQIKWEKEKLIHKDVINKLHKIQVEYKPLKMCMEVSYDLELGKS